MDYKYKNEYLNNHLVGKTIFKIDATACNYWEIYFTDGSLIKLEVEPFVLSVGLYGIGFERSLKSEIAQMLEQGEDSGVSSSINFDSVRSKLKIATTKPCQLCHKRVREDFCSSVCGAMTTNGQTTGKDNK
jgi:hypothetical protein